MLRWFANADAVRELEERGIPIDSNKTVVDNLPGKILEAKTKLSTIEKHFTKEAWALVQRAGNVVFCLYPQTLARHQTLQPLRVHLNKTLSGKLT